METPAARMVRGEDPIRRHVQRALRERMTDNRPHTKILTVPADPTQARQHRRWQSTDGRYPQRGADDGLPAVEAACAEAVAHGVHSADVVLNIRDRQIFCVRPVIRHAFTKRSLNMTANCVFASAHSHGGRFHSAAARFKTNYSSLVAASSEGKCPLVRTARRSLEFSASMAFVV